MDRGVRGDGGSMVRIGESQSTSTYVRPCKCIALFAVGIFQQIILEALKHILSSLL